MTATGSHSTVSRAARRVLWSLPEPVKKRISAVYRAIRPPAPRAASISFPADIADREALRDFLADTDVFGHAIEEGQAYLSHALERFRITLAITPEMPSGTRALELGSNPYFFTRMLFRRGLHVTCANWFGELAAMDSKGRQVISSPGSGESHEIEFDHFNMEVDRFPYEEESFDLVFMCEILEHLPQDPINALAEIHRVLKKPGGVLVLSTPNPVRAENLVKMVSGENVYEPLSGYGVHGRHNREYTVDELGKLLGELGFEVAEMFTADVTPEAPAIPTSMRGRKAEDRGEYVFVVAGAAGPDRWRYPEWLYLSRHALRRVVLPHLVMGRNDDLQADGFHDLESIAGRDVRWMGKSLEARVQLSADFSGSGSLRVEGLSAPVELGGAIVLGVQLGDVEATHEIVSGSGWFEVDFPVEVEAGDQEVVLFTDRRWRPVDIGAGADDRDLSLAISAVSVIPRR